MCFLKAFSNTRSFKGFAASTAMPVYSCADKGERRTSKGAVHAEHRISFNVSDKEWDDIEGQIKDAISFLKRWKTDLAKLIRSHKADAYLDFPLYSRLDGHIVNQNDHLPSELIVLAGRIGLGIEMALYDKNAFSSSED